MFARNSSTFVQSGCGDRGGPTRFIRWLLETCRASEVDPKLKRLTTGTVEAHNSGSPGARFMSPLV